MIKRRIPDNWLLPDDWVEQCQTAIGKRFPYKNIADKFIIIDDTDLTPEDITTIRATVLSLREVITDITS